MIDLEYVGILERKKMTNLNSIDLPIKNCLGYLTIDDFVVVVTV